jgi:competence protein ComEC
MIRSSDPRGPAPALPLAALAVAGVWVGAFQSGQVRPALALAAVSGLWAFVRRRSARGALLPVFALAAAAGYLSGSLRIGRPEKRVETLLRSSARETPLVVTGRLSSFWSGAPPLRRARIDVAKLERGGEECEAAGQWEVLLAGEQAPLAERGDRVRVTGFLREIHVPVSDRDLPGPAPARFLSVKSAGLVQKLSGTLLSRLFWPNVVLERALGRALADRPQERAAAATLVLGRTGELDRDIRDRFRRGGLYHLVVVSGLHVGLCAALVFELLSAVGCRGRPRDLALGFSLLGFLFLSGAAVPVVRATAVLLVFLLARLLERPVSPMQAVGVAAAGVALAAPLEIFGIGFWLTFSAAFGIAGLSAPVASLFPRRPPWLFGSWAVALAAQAAVAPLLLWRFNLLSVGGLVGSPIEVPVLMAALICALATVGAAALGIPAAVPAAGLGACVRFLEVLSDASAKLASYRPTPPLAAVAALCGLLCVVVFARGRLRWVTAGAWAVLFLFVIFQRPESMPAGGFSVEALDVGQGDAILVRSNGGSLLIDGGGGFDAEQVDFGRTRLVPKLLDRGVVRLDAVALTHPHPDHALGLFAVLSELPVAEFWRGEGADQSEFYQRLESLARTRGISIRTFRVGDRLKWRGASIRCWHSGGRVRKKDPVNNASLVLSVEKAGRRALLMGDAGEPVERELVDAGIGPTDILKIGHHGSRTSSGIGFLRVVRPRLALISCGRDNRFGHPAREVLENLGHIHAAVLRTDRASDVGVWLGAGRSRVVVRDWP